MKKFLTFIFVSFLAILCFAERRVFISWNYRTLGQDSRGAMLEDIVRLANEKEKMGYNVYIKRMDGENCNYIIVQWSMSPITDPEVTEKIIVKEK